MYQSPEEFDFLVHERARELLGDEPQWKTLVRDELSGSVLEPLAVEGPSPWEKLPERPAGAGPPHFGVDPAFRVDLNAPYGLLPNNLYYPCWPVAVRRLGAPEPARAGDLVHVEAAPGPRVKPERAMECSTVFEHVHDERGNNYVVRWPKPVKFTDG